jgi:hypothetical protein
MEPLDTPVLPVKMEQARQGGDMLHPVVPNCIRTAAVGVDVGGKDAESTRHAISWRRFAVLSSSNQAPGTHQHCTLLSPPDVRARLAMAKTPV